MTKKFDVVIGNPPYQDDLIGDNETKAPPIYDRFMDAAFDVAEQAVLITPARFLSNAGQTPKAWNAKMLSDEHLRVAIFEHNSAAIFPGTDIKGGIVVTHRDASKTLGPIGHMAHMKSMESTVTKVTAQKHEPLSSIITEHPCKWTPTVFTENPHLADRIPQKSGARLKTNTFTRMSEVCLQNEPNDGHEYIQVLGLDGPSLDPKRLPRNPACRSEVQAGRLKGERIRRVWGSPHLAERVRSWSRAHSDLHCHWLI